jgi:hypothetical protein
MHCQKTGLDQQTSAVSHYQLWFPPVLVFFTNTSAHPRYGLESSNLKILIHKMRLRSICNLQGTGMRLPLSTNGVRVARPEKKKESTRNEKINA